MNTLVFGGSGQVGHALLHALQPVAGVTATTRSGDLDGGVPCERANFDAPHELVALLDRLRPDTVVNAAAYTAVDKAETDRDAAFRVNAEAPGVIAQWCARNGALMVHYSTDYVFDGRGTRPYREDDATGPLGAYGQSKLAGETAIRAAGGRHMIFRTSWIYGAFGRNFMRTMLNAGRERRELKVVVDQVGTPTPAALIAQITAQILQRSCTPTGTWHLTASGGTTWYGFAEAIFAEALSLGLLEVAPRVLPVATAEFPTVARRPAYSRLDVSRLQQEFDVQLPDWREGLRSVIDQLAGRS